jgi:thermolysin
MKKVFAILTVVAGAVLAFGIVSKRAEANKTVFGTGSRDELEIAKQISLGILRDRAAQRSIGNADEFAVMRLEIDDLKMAHMRVQQTIGGVRVWGGEAIVHLKSDGGLFAVTDDLRDGISLNTTPNYTADDAVNIACGMYKGSKFLTTEPTADLWIYRGDDRDHLTYRVQMRREDGSKDTAMPVIFVDAQTGEKVFQYDNLQTGTGPSLYSGTVTIGTSQVGSTYYMENLTRKVGTFNYNNGTSTAARFTDTDDVWNATAQRAGVDASYGAEATMNYYQSVFGRNGIDGSGGPLTSSGGSPSLISSRVHYSSNYNNAFWNGSYMTYGDGNGTTFTPLVTLDICGHEMTHGVTERTANLTYSGESGALNESMSDVFGTMVERYARPSNWNWKIGEDAYTPATAGDALRYMDNPHLASNGGYTADDDPDHYSERYTGTSDNGGVHINSGISNNVFYHVAQGGTNHLTPGVTALGIGPDKAAAIWYRALTTYMTSSTNFAGARTATLNAATALYGSTGPEYTAVATSWCISGVGACPGTPTPTPTATPGGSELFLNGGFETSVNPWVSSGAGALYIANGNYPHGGTGYVYYGTANSVAGQTYQQVTIPANATGNMTFWLNVTSDETTTSTQYDKLFVEVRNTAGTLLTTLATYSNLNKGAAGAYSQKSLSLAAYKGQTVRVQFRVTTDSSLLTTFRVDDASLK